MKKSMFILTFIFFIIGPLFLGQTVKAETKFKPIYAPTKGSTSAPPIPMKDGKTDWPTIHELYLKENNIPQFIYIGGQSYELSIKYLFQRHLVVYGDQYDLPLNKRSSEKTYSYGSSSFSTNRHIGFTIKAAGATCMTSKKSCEGNPNGGSKAKIYSDPYYPDDKTASSLYDQWKYVQVSRFASAPWEKTSAAYKYSTSHTMFPHPKNDINLKDGEVDVTKEKRIEELGHAIDRFAFTKYKDMNDFRGYFAEESTRYCTDGTVTSDINIECKSGKKWVTKTTEKDEDGDFIYKGTRLSKYAALMSYRTEFTPGHFVLYKKGCGSASAYCYATFLTSPIVDPLVPPPPPPTPPKLDLECSPFTKQQNIKTKVSGETVIFTVDFDVNFKTDAKKVPFAAEWLLDGKTIGKKVSGTVDIENDKSLQKKITIDIPELPAGQTQKDLKFTISLDPTHTYSLGYKTFKTIKETNVLNNDCGYTVTVDNRGDASIEMTEIQTGVGVPLTADITVTNHMNSRIKAPCGGDSTYAACKSSASRTTYQATLTKINVDGTKTVILKKTLSFDLVKGKIKSYNLSAFKFSEVTAGNYELALELPHYLGETDYTNNQVTKTFSISPFVPDNVECKSLYPDYLTFKKTIPVTPKDEDGDTDVEDGLTKICLGYTPTYPSTKVEDGKGTLFFVSYNVFPMPIPPYTVTNTDAAGIFQTTSLTEAKTAKGEKDSFTYYPTADNPAKLGAPYAAGPHDFYHYLYRGRLMPSQITFKFLIREPNDNVLKHQNETVTGEVKINLDPATCYEADKLDLKAACKNYFFYLPKESTDKANDINALKNVPQKEEDLIYFNNVGMHSFEFTADETQNYWYQWDNHMTADGGEWQGDGKSLTQNGTTTPVRTHYVTKNPTTATANSDYTWYIRDDLKNAKEVHKNSTANYYFYNQCFVNDTAFNEALKSASATSLSADSYTFNSSTGTYCTHNHDAAFHYWKYNWDLPKKYNGTFTKQ